MSKVILPRRAFLQGAGLALGLPFLDAMRPARAAVAARPPVRLAFVFFPNGCVMDSWTPQGTGRDYTLSETLSALSEFQGDLTVLSRLAQDNGRAKGDGPGDHARCASSYLTGAHPFKTAGADIKLGVSVDQAAAAAIGQHTKLPSLELGIERNQNAGNCDSGYSCAYSSNISWKSESVPMAKEINPRLAFERLFGSGDAEQGPAAAARRFYRQSVLDLVAKDADRLRAKLGADDRQKVDEYFTSVRELEQRVERAGRPVAAPDGFQAPSGKPSDLTEHIRLMYDILTLAFQTDSTRIATYMLANAGSNRSYGMVGVNEGHHELSHHGRDQEKLAKIQKIDRYLCEQFAYFLGRLRSIPEGDGTLLDNCLVMYGSGLSDGNRHDHADLPIVLAGRGGGTVRTGEHLDLGQETPLNNLFLSLLDRVGAGVESIGDSSGRLTAIDA